MTRANPATTPISPSKSAALGRVIDAVPKGYSHYVAGRCPVRKAAALARKFHERYGIGCSPAQRITRKQKGLANALLVMYWPGFGEDPQEDEREAGQESRQEVEPDIPREDEAADVEWLLLATAGSGAVHDMEALQSVQASSRLCWLGYELVRQPKRGRASWTWRRPKAAMADWYAVLGSQLASRKWAAVTNTLRLISRQPGFSGVRRQSWELCQFARQRGYPEALPFLFHLEKLAHGVPLRLE